LDKGGGIRRINSKSNESFTPPEIRGEGKVEGKFERRLGQGGKIETYGESTFR